jgi:hypothetical protein
MPGVVALRTYIIRWFGFAIKGRLEKERVCVSGRIGSWRLASARSTGGDPARGGEAFRGSPHGLGMGPLAKLRATRNSYRECLTLRERPASGKEDDAFLARLRMQGIWLLMEDGPYSTRALGMRHPYRQAASGQCAFHQGHPSGLACSKGSAPGSKRARL